MASEFQSFLEDLFAPLDDVRFGRMFGGLGIYRGGVMFALVSDDVLYFKADDSNRGAFEAEGSAPFRFEARGKLVTTSYWRAPERLYDEPDAFREWALAAIEVAERARADPRRSKKRASGKKRAARSQP